MSVFLRVHDVDGISDVTILQSGLEVKVGRGDHNDVAYPNDGQMSFDHCVIMLLGDRCVVRDLNSTNGTWVNSDRVVEAELVHGDRFRCGQTEFTVEWSFQPERPVTAAPAPSFAGQTIHCMLGNREVSVGSDPEDDGGIVSEELIATCGFIERTAQEIVNRFELQTKLRIMPEPDELPAEFVSRLLTVSPADAINFVAFALPRRCAVWWTVECIRLTADLTTSDMALFDLIIKWLKKPTDDNRRAVMEYVTENGFETLGIWAAQAAFYSHGSTTPEATSFVAARDDLCGKTAYAGVSMAAVDGGLDEVVDRQQKYVQLALEIADARHCWDAARISAG